MRRKMRVVTMTLLLFGMALVCRPAAAQNNAGISGQVLDIEGKPFPEVTVTLKNTDSGLTYTTKTDKSGRYVQLGMRPGPYDITLKARDKEILGTNCMVQAIADNKFDMNLKELVKKESGEVAAARKKQEEEHGKFEAMKTHFNAGVAKTDEAKQVRADMAKLPADQRAPVQEKLNGIYQDAMNEFQQAQQAAPPKDPNLYLVYSRIGDTADSLKKNDEAVAAYQKAIELKPDVALLHANLALSFAKLGKTQEAEQEFEKSVALDPPNAATSWLNFGIVLYNSNRLAEAVVPLKKATALNPKNADAWYLLGASMLATIDTKQVGEKLTYIIQPGTVEAYQKYLELEPNGVHANDARAALQSLQALGAGVDTKLKVKKGKS
jgi:tetratricopeptide (TPR) repeat protein